MVVSPPGADTCFIIHATHSRHSGLSVYKRTSTSHNNFFHSFSVGAWGQAVVYLRDRLSSLYQQVMNNSSGTELRDMWHEAIASIENYLFRFTNQYSSGPTRGPRTSGRSGQAGSHDVQPWPASGTIRSGYSNRGWYESTSFWGWRQGGTYSWSFSDAAWRDTSAHVWEPHRAYHADITRGERESDMDGRRASSPVCL